MSRPRRGPVDLTGKVVAITGGARGIGRCTAEAFLVRGARVVIGDVDVDLVEKVAAELASLTGAEVVGLGLDVTDRLAFATFLDRVEEQFGPLDVLVNNAGIMPTGLFAVETDAMTDRIVAININGVLNGSKLAAKRFGDRRAGHVVNLASLAGVTPTAGLATYCGTKHFVIGFTESLHRELAPLGVGVTVVLPGVVRTELSAGAKVPAWAEGVTTVNPEDVAAAVVSVVGTRRIRSTRPRILSAVVRATPLMTERIRLRVERVTRLDELMTGADPAARAAYHARISGVGD